VNPVGFIVVSLRKELAPVKAYSATCDLDPESNEGMSGFLKTKLEGILDAIEQPIQLLSVNVDADFQGILEIDYRPAWDELCEQNKLIYKNLESDRILMNYQKGQVLLTSNWHQGPPYNNLCPEMGCNYPPSCFNKNALAGCGAIATAQIMRYWAWPPWGVDQNNSNSGADYTNFYDWAKMPDELTVSSEPIQIDAVAELCYEVGIALNSEYGCSDTVSSGMSQLSGFKNNFRYAGADINEILLNMELRFDYNAKDWFRLIKDVLGKNRPIPYATLDHFLVIDGWKETVAGMQYHVNYGWADSKTAWFAIDAIPGGDLNEDYMLVRILPSRALGSEISGWYPLDIMFPYRYFDQDATGQNVTFERGHNLQFLPGVKVTGKSSIGDYIQFVGTNPENTRLFSLKGTQTGAIVSGIKIYDGSIRLYNDGSIRFH
jgi:hypothetical protein